MTPLESALAFTFLHETGGDQTGALHTDPHDPGGTTKWGISQRAYPTLNVAALTRKDAAQIAERDYWKAASCDRLPGPIAVAHFDCAFASGPYRAVLLLQLLVGAKPDGEIGPATISALASFVGGRGERVAASMLVVARARWLCNLMDEPDKPEERRRLRFVEGWVVRVVELAAYVSRIG